MSLSRNDKDWIRDAVKGVGQNETANPRNGSTSAKVGRFVSQWGLMAVGLTLLGFGCNHLLEEAEFRGSVGPRFTAIETRLGTIEIDIRTILAGVAPQRMLSEIAQFDQEMFARNLSALAALPEHPQQSVSLDPNLVQSVSARLRQVDTFTTDYWPALLRFLQFASATVTSDDVPPAGSPVNFFLRNNRGLELGPMSGQVIVLDGGELFDSRIENSRVIFTENPVLLSNVTFINCAFELPVSDSPSQYLQDAGQQLLAATDLTSLTLALSG